VLVHHWLYFIQIYIWFKCFLVWVEERLKKAVFWGWTLQS
jgi:hypothetical protein